MSNPLQDHDWTIPKWWVCEVTIGDADNDRPTVHHVGIMKVLKGWLYDCTNCPPFLIDDPSHEMKWALREKTGEELPNRKPPPSWLSVIPGKPDDA